MSRWAFLVLRSFPLVVLCTSFPLYAQDWEPVGLDGVLVTEIVVDQNNPSILFVATDDGVYKTVDSGLTWSLSFSGGRSASVAYSSPDNIYCTQSTSVAPGVFRSTDFGLSWELVSSAIQWWPVEVPNWLAIDPENDSTVYLATGALGSGRVLKTTDSGTTWFEASDSLLGGGPWGIFIDSSRPEYVYVPNCCGLVFSRDGGDTWQLPTNGPEMGGRAFSIDPTNPNHLFHGSLDTFGSFKSIDAGLTWISNNTGLTSTQLRYCISLDHPAEQAFLATGDEGVFWSTDTGESWMPYGAGSPNQILCLAVDQASGWLYAGGQGVHRVPIITTGVDNEGTSDPVLDWGVYPNPSNGVFHVKLGPSLRGDRRIAVVDVLGRLVAARIPSDGSAVETFETRNWPTGVYFVNLLSGSNLQTRKALTIK